MDQQQQTEPATIINPAETEHLRYARQAGAEPAYDNWNAVDPPDSHPERWRRICECMRSEHWQHVLGDDPTAIAERYRPEADLTSGPRAAAEWRWAAAQHAGTGTAAVGRFWALRPTYTHLHQFARSRLVAPWAVLGATLARVATAAPPTATLPPIVGGKASLNAFIALVGPPGAGKNAAVSVAKEALQTPPIDTVPLGSGEGISHMFMRRPRPTKADPDPEPEQYREKCLVTIGEIDTFMAVAGRRGATLGAQIRQAAMGEELGFFYVDTSKRLLVPEHSYRLCVIAGIQPKRAGSILVGPEADGGTPQRFIWLPALDPTLTERAAEVAPMRWDPPIWPDRGTHLGVCGLAWDHVTARRIEAVQAGLDEMEAHATLLRLRVAAILALIDGRTTVAEDDWHISQIVMDMSTLTREHCVQVLCEVAAETNRRQGEAEAARAAVLEVSADERTMSRVCNAVVRKLAKVGGPVSQGQLNKTLAGRDRAYLDAALDRLLGDVIEVDPGSPGGRKTAYRLIAG
jgi:hypothetical protein